jgi:hypothetical protein
MALRLIHKAASLVEVPIRAATELRSVVATAFGTDCHGHIAIDAIRQISRWELSG